MYIPFFYTHPLSCFGLETMMAPTLSSTLSVLVGFTSVLWQFMSPQSMSREPATACADSITRLSDTLASRPSQQCSPITVSLGPFLESSFCRPVVLPSVHPLLIPEMAIFAWAFALSGWVSLITCHVCRRRSAPINVHTHVSDVADAGAQWAYDTKHHASPGSGLRAPHAHSARSLPSVRAMAAQFRTLDVAEPQVIVEYPNDPGGYFWHPACRSTCWSAGTSLSPRIRLPTSTPSIRSPLHPFASSSDSQR